ncbi:recombinase family protein [Caproicibacter sp. BJN0012]|uniref:recombinase family protein n=1 Tax=Caproicibacter sp. BJN0012 TaxID=3110227 RepID=UPI002E0F0EB1|nr:recombinase family protein [Caproicibacter sp. BJN0012]
MQATVNAGIYCRLSVDDPDTDESESIQTQKAMLTDYCHQHGFHIVDYFIDDGVSGTSFDRPDFRRMLDAIESGTINTVICKDLSRFGRNYYESGMYLDNYFIRKNIRFIAPGNSVDSANGAYNLSVPILNMMNDFYARDISTKTRDAKKARAKQGMYLAAKAPYGYIKDPADRHHLIVDEDAAAIVRRIFDMAAHGAGYNKIARTLHAEDIPNPLTYFNQKNPDYYHSDYWKQGTQWHVTSIQSILNNPVYLGCVAHNRVGSKVMNGKTEKKAREDWIVVEHTHEPLVSAEQWEIVHKQMESRRRAQKDGEPQMFAGLLYCSDCGSALSFSAVHRKTKPDGGQYKCWYYMRHGKEYCSSHYITLDQISTVVLDDVRRQARYAYLYHGQYLKTLREAKAEQGVKQLQSWKKEAEKCKKRLAALDGILKKLLEQNAAGAITNERFAALSADYEQERKALEEAVADYEKAAQSAREGEEQAEQFVELIQEYTNLTALDARILNKLIDKIVVHQREKDAEGNITQLVEIYYKFVGMTVLNFKEQ